MHQGVKAVATGNVTEQEPVDLLTISSVIRKEQERTDAEEFVQQRRVTNDVIESDHDYSDTSTLTNMFWPH